MWFILGLFEPLIESFHSHFMAAIHCSYSTLFLLTLSAPLCCFSFVSLHGSQMRLPIAFFVSSVCSSAWRAWRRVSKIRQIDVLHNYRLAWTMRRVRK